MKKTPILLAALLICALFFVACGKAEEENKIENGPENMHEAVEQSFDETEEVESDKRDTEEMTAQIERQKELYALSIGKLELLLSENRGHESNVYQEYVDTLYLYAKSYSGTLQADYNESGTISYQMCMSDYHTGERHRYECRLLSDGSLWFTYQRENPSEKELPDYLVSEDTLRYRRADYVYDDGEKDLEEEKKLRSQEIEESVAEEIGGDIQEFWCCQDMIYQVEREKECFVDVTMQKESCIAAFLKEEAKRINCQLKLSEAAMEEVKKYKPEGYSLLSGESAWDEIAACDLNNDGRMDYVVVLYPDDYEEIQRYPDGSVYERTSKYYASCFWLLLSSEDESYEQIQLSDSVEYWEEDALVLIENVFVDEGILQLEYFIGRSPHSNAQLRFQYDKETQNFYILNSCYRKAFNDKLVIGDIADYGKISMYSYYDKNCSIRYTCADASKEKQINSVIEVMEYEFAQALRKDYPLSEYTFSRSANIIFSNQKIVSSEIGIFVVDQENRYYMSARMPVMVDKQSGKPIAVTGLIEKEDFIRVLEDWSGDVHARVHTNAQRADEMTEKEKEQYKKLIAEWWEKADSVENYAVKEKDILFLQIISDGVRMRVYSEADDKMKDYIIDKEYFIGTEIWDYFKPMLLG